MLTWQGRVVDARLKLLDPSRCRHSKLRRGNAEVHAVTFQPLGSKYNNDHLVTQSWEILGQQWLMLAVFDGYRGDATARYVARSLLGRIQERLREIIVDTFGGLLDRLNCDAAEPVVSSMLEEEVLACERRLVQSVSSICPENRNLTEDDARGLFQRHGEEITRAKCGTTISLALVAVEEHFMWAVNVGNSSVGDAYTVHRPADSGKLSKAADERPFVWLNTSRVLGAILHKAPYAYLRDLFHYAYQNQGTRTPEPPAVVEKISSNLSLKANPSVRFIDLKPMRDKDPILVLFTDGVNCLVNGSTVFTPGVSSSAHPLTVMASMLAGPDRDLSIFPTKSPMSLELALGHGVDFGWSRAHGVDNMAVEILFNLLGGFNADRLEQVVNWDRAIAHNPNLFIDDTTLIVARLGRALPVMSSAESAS
ncbi:hypothetical protein ACG7TL_006949 [Trametes sanguinea]